MWPRKSCSEIRSWCCGLRHTWLAGRVNIIFHPSFIYYPPCCSAVIGLTVIHSDGDAWHPAQGHRPVSGTAPVWVQIWEEHCVADGTNWWQEDFNELLLSYLASSDLMCQLKNKPLYALSEDYCSESRSVEDQLLCLGSKSYWTWFGPSFSCWTELFGLQRSSWSTQ